MTDSTEWRRIWDVRAKESVSDFDLDRGFARREEEIERLSDQELIEFIQPKVTDTVLDAGCGTGVNIVRLNSRVKKIIGIDYTAGSIERCQKRIREQTIANAEVIIGSISAVPLANCSVDKILCLSVLQYLEDSEVRQVLREFARLLAPEGVIILHVKNQSSLYWSTLLAAKKLKKLLGRRTSVYKVRPFEWYIKELNWAGFDVVDFNGFNLLTLDFMPRVLLSFLQKSELRHCRDWFFQSPMVRRHGADLKIKAKIGINRAEIETRRAEKDSGICENIEHLV